MTLLTRTLQNRRDVLGEGGRPGLRGRSLRRDRQGSQGCDEHTENRGGPCEALHTIASQSRRARIWKVTVAQLATGRAEKRGQVGAHLWCPPSGGLSRLKPAPTFSKTRPRFQSHVRSGLAGPVRT